MRGRLAHARAAKEAKASINDEPSPALSTRRSKLLLQNGTNSRDLTVSEDVSRQSSVSLDMYGLPAEDDSDLGRPSKRRKKEAADSPPESVSSRRTRNRSSPVQTLLAAVAKESASHRKSIPGIEISREKDDSDSPVSEAASVLEPLPAIRQALRISFNAKGGGKLTISNTGTPTPSVPGSARPSPAPGLPATEANTPEEINALKQQLKKIPGRRRNPHKDPKIEAAIRRQADLKKCYRTIARALKPILVELSTRGINELEEDEEAHKTYPEYHEILKALDYHYEKRQKALDAQLTYSLKLNEQNFRQETEYTQQKFDDQIGELTELHAMEAMKTMRAMHRMNEYKTDPYMTEDDFDDEFVPLRNPNAYILPIKDPKYNLSNEYESRSRKLVLLNQASDHIGCLRSFGKQFKKAYNERNPKWDRKYGPLKSGRYTEPSYDMQAIAREQDRLYGQQERVDQQGAISGSGKSDTASNRLAALLEALEKEAAAADAVPPPSIAPKQAIESFDALFEAIQIREETSESKQNEPAAAQSELAALEVQEQNHDVGNANIIEAHVDQDSATRVIAQEQYDRILKSPNATPPRRNPETPAVQETDEPLDTPRPDSKVNGSVIKLQSPPSVSWSAPVSRDEPQTSIEASRSHTELIGHDIVSAAAMISRMVDAPVLPQTPASEATAAQFAPKYDGSREQARRQSRRLALQADQLLTDEYRRRASYVPSDWVTEAGNLREDVVAARKFFRLPPRIGSDPQKFWSSLRREKQEKWLMSTEPSPPPQREESQISLPEKEVITVDMFGASGRYGHLDIPLVYAELIGQSGPYDYLYGLWKLADAHIPIDANRPLDRDAFMELAETAEMARYKFYEAKWHAWRHFYENASRSVTASLSNEDKAQGFASMLENEKFMLKPSEERLERALKTWPLYLEATSNGKRIVNREDFDLAAQKAEQMGKDNAQQTKVEDS